MRISDWSSDVCSSDLTRAADAGGAWRHLDLDPAARRGQRLQPDRHRRRRRAAGRRTGMDRRPLDHPGGADPVPAAGRGSRVTPDVRTGVAAQAPAFRGRSEEHTSELQSLMRISYAVFCLKKKKKTK